MCTSPDYQALWATHFVQTLLDCRDFNNQDYSGKDILGRYILRPILDNPPQTNINPNNNHTSTETMSTGTTTSTTIVKTETVILPQFFECYKVNPKAELSSDELSSNDQIEEIVTERISEHDYGTYAQYHHPWMRLQYPKPHYWNPQIIQGHHPIHQVIYLVKIVEWSQCPTPHPHQLTVSITLYNPNTMY